VNDPRNFVLAAMDILPRLRNGTTETGFQFISGLTIMRKGRTVWR
jgi:hypothetical protein